MDGSHDLAGLLVECVRAPVRVEEVQLSDQPVVLSQKECVQSDHTQVLIRSGITCETLIINNSSSEASREQIAHYSVVKSNSTFTLVA